MVVNFWKREVRSALLYTAFNTLVTVAKSGDKDDFPQPTNSVHPIEFDSNPSLGGKYVVAILWAAIIFQMRTGDTSRSQCEALAIFPSCEKKLV